MSREGLDALRARVADDAAFARRLRCLPVAAFVAETAQIAREAGYDVAEDDLRAAAADGARAWLMRWLA
ncbi:MAG: Nif11-like leader peptide family natural product precursor [Candidatus Eremiobacteraeota bacterium]|nr:Nif11-like leader peptide family natural product precursor [Candidatus Eremiobacteraeota bacterium]